MSLIRPLIKAGPIGLALSSPKRSELVELVWEIVLKGSNIMPPIIENKILRMLVGLILKKKILERTLIKDFSN